MADQNQDKDRQLDALLDSLLHSYSAADPRPGYETRLRAVVAARATRVPRTNLWMPAASAAAVALLAWIMLASMHPAKTVPDSVAVKPSIPVPSSANIGAMVRPKRANKPVTSGRTATVGKEADIRIILEIAKATNGVGNVVFEREKLYLTPENRPEPPAAPAEQARSRAPDISIKDLGVAPIETSAPIEIKDLSSSKSTNEKGSL